MEVKLEVKMEVKLEVKLEVKMEVKLEVIKGQYHIGRQHPRLSSCQLVGLTSCAKRITPCLNPSYNSRNFN